MSSTESMSLPHVEQEKDTHVERRRASLPVAWDSNDADGSLHGTGGADHDNKEETTTIRAADFLQSPEGLDLGSLSIYGQTQTQQQQQNNGNSISSSSPFMMSGSSEDDAATAMNILTQKLIDKNPSLASVNKSVAHRVLELLKNVRKKKGVSLSAASAAAASSSPDDTSTAASTHAFTELKEQQEAAYRTLSQVPPFSYLPNDERHSLVQDLHQVEYTDGEIILNQNDNDNDVYVLAQGRIVMVQIQKNKFVGYLDAPACFGEWGILFDAARNNQVVAGAPTTTVYRMQGRRFQALLQHSAFRLKLALGLRQNGIFSHIDSFVAIVRRAVAHDDLFDFWSILQSYRKMTPAIHANLQSSHLDLEGWTYAIRRLPDTVTSTFVYVLANHIPMPFMHPDFDLRAVQVLTVARRRQAFALDRLGGSGKLLVVMREKYSDVLDFLSLLCVHVHESAKLRRKLSTPSALHVIHTCLWSSKREQQPDIVGEGITTMFGNTGLHQRQYTPASLEEQKTALLKLPLTEQEKAGLQSIWPHDFLYRIWDIIALHENIQIRSDLASAYIDSTDRWAESIRREATDLLNPNGDICVRSEIITHIISSNTTSVRNLLSPHILKNKSAIQEWGKQTHPEIMAHTELSESDKLCALCNAYMNQHPGVSKEQDVFDKYCFRTLRRTEMTGIQVDLIDLNALEDTYAEFDIEPDPFLASCFPRYRPDQGWCSRDEAKSKEKFRLLINIDYAFGKQAEQLISALSLLFGQSLSSVGVMGKAGGLQGRRGDIIVAEYLVHQEGDEQTLIDNTGVDREALHSLSGRTVHSGGVLTVLGTLLQDTRLLNFYKKLHGCVSLEMEGSFYARELRRYKKAGLISDSVHQRFLYYISDTPLSADQTETLSQDLSIAEVIPPQYAVTRVLLHPVLSKRE